MSYSVCINCETMVHLYGKYCDKCVKEHSLKQDEDWHKSYHQDINIKDELKKDKKK